MKSHLILVALPAALFIVGSGGAIAGQTINEAGAIVCVNDKWDEKETEKGHKLVDAVQRCVIVPDDAAAPKAREECVGKFEYLPDGSWKGAGTCTNHYTDGDTTSIVWEEGSRLLQL